MADRQAVLAPYSHMRILPAALLLLASFASACATDDAGKKRSDDTVFRKPFTLKLHVDKEHFYEEKFDKMPFVHDGDVA